MLEVFLFVSPSHGISKWAWASVYQLNDHGGTSLTLDIAPPPLRPRYWGLRLSKVYIFYLYLVISKLLMFVIGNHDSNKKTEFRQTIKICRALSQPPSYKETFSFRWVISRLLMFVIGNHNSNKKEIQSNDKDVLFHLISFNTFGMWVHSCCTLTKSNVNGSWKCFLSHLPWSKVRFNKISRIN